MRSNWLNYVGIGELGLQTAEARDVTLSTLSCLIPLLPTPPSFRLLSRFSYIPWTNHHLCLHCSPAPFPEWKTPPQIGVKPANCYKRPSYHTIRIFMPPSTIYTPLKIKTEVVITCGLQVWPSHSNGISNQTDWVGPRKTVTPISL